MKSKKIVSFLAGVALLCYVVSELKREGRLLYGNLLYFTITGVILIIAPFLGDKGIK